MAKFLERHSLPKLTKEEIKNLTSPLSVKYIELVIKSPAIKKTQDPTSFTGEFF